MINFTNKSYIMLQKFLIFSLCIVAIQASGEFSVLSSPKSLSFKGNDPLQSEYVADVLSAAIGNVVDDDVQWSGLSINNPFDLPKSFLVVLVDGVNHISLNSNAKTYKMHGNDVDESLNSIKAELKSNNIEMCDLNFSAFDEAITSYESCFGDIVIPSIKETGSLNPEANLSDKQFLQSMYMINKASDILSAQKTFSNPIIIRLSLESLAKVHGEKSSAMTEARKLVSSSVSKLNAEIQKLNNNEAIVVVIADKTSGSRTKRNTRAQSTTDDFNLAEYYSEDYPVIFNIILWFMVTFGLALLAICYAIGSMDPGRDSIIYRMTSTRMKKDN